MIFYGSKMDVVRFVLELQKHFENGSPSITITRVEKSAVYSVSIVTDGLSEDTVKNLAQSYSLQDTNTSQPNTAAGLFQRERKRKEK